MNFLAGTAKGETVQTGKGEFPNPQQLAGPVVVAIRPEDVRIGEAGDRADQALSGRIKQAMVLGHYAELSIETELGGTIRSFLPKDAVRELAVGQNVRLSFAKTMVYPNINESSGG
jgi:putative spermidine/putrescine transport system ATP-binding protein